MCWAALGAHQTVADLVEERLVPSLRAQHSLIDDGIEHLARETEGHDEDADEDEPQA